MSDENQNNSNQPSSASQNANESNFEILDIANAVSETAGRLLTQNV